MFSRFLEGTSLEECYSAVADIANYWLDVLYTQVRMEGGRGGGACRPTRLHLRAVAYIATW